MVRLAIVYPNGEGKRFDLKYDIERHMAGAHQMLGPYGLVRVEVDRPLDPGPIACVGYFYFETLDGLHRAMEARGGELVADVPNYTDITPQLYAGEVTEVAAV
jgi:uncharacterized protein (TIGR02118 family)